MKKICNRCKVEKDVSEFYNQKYGKFGVRGICKVCCREQDKIDRENNTDKYLERERNYRKSNWAKIVKRRKTKLQNNSNFRFKTSVRSLIGGAFKRKGYKKGRKSKEILECSIEEFRVYIESRFEPWMNWENYGGVGVKTKNTNWDLDHIIPIKEGLSPKEIIKLNHYTNFQPLCSFTNRYIKRSNYEKR